MNIKELSEKAEIEQYASTPPSGRGTRSTDIILKDVLPEVKTISIRKPFAMIVGSMATQGKSNNDIDIVVRGEDFSDKIKEAINFRIYRLFSGILKCAYDDTPKFVHIHYNNTGSYTSYVPLFELDLIPISNPQVIEMSRIPLTIHGNLNIVNKANSGKRIIAGYASVAVVDLEEQYIPPDTLREGIQTLINDPAYSNLMLVHKNIQIGKILQKYEEYETKVDEKGLFIVAEIRSDLKTADEVWNAILEKQFNGFSIGCEVLLSHKQCDENKCVTILDKINIFEVSVCSQPVNQESGFIVISKSKYCGESSDPVCESCKNIEVKMPEEKKEPVVAPTNPVPEEQKPQEGSCKTVDERVAGLERDMNSITKAIQELTTLMQELAKKPEEKPVEGKPAEEKPVDSNYPNPNPEPTSPPVAEDLAKKPVEPVKPAEEPKPEDKPKPSEYPNPSQYPYPAKKDFDDLKSSIDKLILALSDKGKEEEYKLAIKARDDQIESLKKQTEIKPNPEPKTIKATPAPKMESLIAVDHGTVYLND